MPVYSLVRLLFIWIRPLSLRTAAYAVSAALACLLPDLQWAFSLCQGYVPCFATSRPSSLLGFYPASDDFLCAASSTFTNDVPMAVSSATIAVLILSIFVLSLRTSAKDMWFLTAAALRL